MLTPRQMEIAALVAHGLSNKAIARRLNLAEGTIKVQLHTIYKRLRLSNRTQCAAWVITSEYAA